MATYSIDDLAHKVLAMYVRDRTEAGQVLSRHDLLAKWPKGFTHVELTAALDYACAKEGKFTGSQDDVSKSLGQDCRRKAQTVAQKRGRVIEETPNLERLGEVQNVNKPFTF